MLALHRSLSVGYLRLHPTCAVLIVLSISLGVATLVATRMLNQSVSKEAPEAVNPMAKIADFVVMNAQTGVPRDLARELKQANIPGLRDAQPVVLGRITLPQLDKNGRSVWLFGLDWTSKELREAQTGADNSWGVEIHWIDDPTQPATVLRLMSERLRGRMPVLIGDKLARDLEKKLPNEGKEFQALAASKRNDLTLLGTVHFNNISALADGNFVIMDVGDAAALIFPQRARMSARSTST